MSMVHAAGRGGSRKARTQASAWPTAMSSERCNSRLHCARSAREMTTTTMTKLRAVPHATPQRAALRWERSAQVARRHCRLCAQLAGSPAHVQHSRQQQQHRRHQRQQRRRVPRWQRGQVPPLARAAQPQQRFGPLCAPWSPRRWCPAQRGRSRACSKHARRRPHPPKRQGPAFPPDPPPRLRQSS